MSSVVFLVGAGASVDAGLPLVAQLTRELRARLPEVRAFGVKGGAEFSELFDALASYEPELEQNYERFFEWLIFLGKAQMGPFSKAVTFNLDKRLADASHRVACGIKTPFWDILRSYHQCDGYSPIYFARLGEFMPGTGRLKVFTTNYDLCIEDGCRSQGIDVTTGFCPTSGEWRPSLFWNGTRGINVYKLHGSLNWGLSDDLSNLQNRPLLERYPPQWDKEPELILGPGSKIQPDDPYATLYAEFHRAIRQAKVCVTIGYSFRDEHIRKPIQCASGRGMAVIDVNPSPSKYNFDRYTQIPMVARDALERGEILKTVKQLGFDGE